MNGPTKHIQVGWCCDREEGAFAFEPPRTVFSTRSRPLSPRSVQNCPAVNELERRLIEIPAPFDLRMRAVEQESGIELFVVPTGTSVSESDIGDFLTIEAVERWRDPRRPLLQIKLPFFLVTDEPCWVTQVPPFLDPALRSWPGSMSAGRFPLHLWPRSLQWPFEWDDFSRDLIIRAREPLCYLLCEFGDQAVRPDLVEAELTPELAEYRSNMEAVGEITDDIEGVWCEAESRRPDRLLVPVENG